MRFRRLKLSGFKSFVDPAELRIEPGLTGIVGPNGCGKSNLLEALRWVMGESSARSMRGGGMEDVIFAGTATRPARSFAEVQLLAERSPDEAVGPAGIAAGDEVEVVRRIERGAGSAYRVNGRDVRAKDVALIFADAATGAHSPALVSQGRIGAVIAAKPTERRAMLEEAAGIAGLHVRRKDAEQKLRATEANLTRLDELIADMETRAGQLKRQARQAERYRQLSGEIRIAEARLLFARWREAAAAADAAKADAAAADEKVHRAAEAQRAAAAWSAEAVAKVAEVRGSAMAARERASEAGHVLATLQAERAALDRRIAELAEQTRRLAADREREGALANDAAEAIRGIAEEIALIDARIAAAEKGGPDLASGLATAELAARDAEVELARALSTQASEQADARVAQAALSAARSRADRATRECERLAQEAAGLGEDAPLIAARDAAAARRAAAEGEARGAAARIERGEAARAAAAEARSEAEGEGAAARSALAALEGEAKALERALASGGGEGTSVLAAMRAAPGYEHALAAALGDDLEAGLEGDRRWAGAERQDGDPALPEGVERLGDHVRAPAALARRLAQIGVVDADDGQPLAVGQRIVTRGGALRRWDGFVTSGEGAATAERLVRANRLAAIGAALPDARGAVDAAEVRLAAARATLAEATGAIEAARQARGEAENSARLAQRDEDQASAAIERLASRRAEIAGRIARAEGEREEAGRELAAAEGSVAALPDGSATAKLVETLRAVSEGARERVSQLKAEA
ncbi:MAG: chromosome segregation protein, partial [Sphingomonas sanxanigenens]